MKQLSIILGVLLLGFIAGYGARYVQLKDELKTSEEALFHYQEIAQQEAAHSLSSKKETELVSNSYNELAKEIAVRGNYSSLQEALAVINEKNNNVPFVNLSNDRGDIVIFKLIRTNDLSEPALQRFFRETVLALSEIQDIKFQFQFKHGGSEKSITFKRADFLN